MSWWSSAQSSPTKIIRSPPDYVVVQPIQSRRPPGGNLMDQCSAARHPISATGNLANRPGHPDRQHTVVAVNADALVRLTRTVPPAIRPTSAPDRPSRVQPPRQQSRLAVGAQFVMVTGLTYRGPVRSILLSRNRFTTSFD